MPSVDVGLCLCFPIYCGQWACVCVCGSGLVLVVVFFFFFLLWTGAGGGASKVEPPSSTLSLLSHAQHQCGFVFVFSNLLEI